MGEQIERRTFRVPMPDGRWLAAEMAGREGADLLVYHCGTPGSRYLYEKMAKECAKQDRRIVCASRPGYDDSPRLKGRSYADNAADTRALLDFLEVESACIVGHSGGGGPALADAALNPDRVQSVAVVSSLAPRYEMGPEWREGLEANEPEITAHDEGESQLRQELGTVAAEMAKAKSAKEVTAHPDFPRFYSPVDQACFEGEFLDFVLELRRHIQKLVDGWLDDDFALYGEWGFDLGSIRIPVTVWQGGQDRIIPIAHPRWLAGQVPRAEYHLRAEEGHVSLMTRCFGAVLDNLLDLAK